MKQIRKRLTYSNVMSSIAVFLVVGGATAFAALGKNTVGTKQLKKNAVTAAKLKKSAVTNAKIAANAVDGAKVADGSLTGSDLNLSALGTVPKATSAETAESAKTALSSKTAESAKTAESSKTAESAKVAGTAFSQESGSDILEFNTVANDPTTVASLNVPAGNYVLWGKVLANNNSGALVSVRCELIAGATTIDQGFEVVRLPAEGGADRQFLAVGGIAAMPTGGVITVNCRSSTTQGNWLNRVLTATQVGTLG